MKIYKLYTLLFFVATLSSCSSDDSKELLKEPSITGTWKGIASTLNGEDLGVPDNGLVIFTADNKVEFIYENFGANGEDISETGVWSKSGDRLTITWDDADAELKTYELEILELNEASLIWETEIEGEGILQETFKK